MNYNFELRLLSQNMQREREGNRIITGEDVERLNKNSNGQTTKGQEKIKIHRKQ